MAGMPTTQVPRLWPSVLASASDSEEQAPLLPAISASNSVMGIDAMAWSPIPRWRIEIEHILAGQAESIGGQRIYRDIRWPTDLDLSATFEPRDHTLNISNRYVAAYLSATETFPLCRFTKPSPRDADLVLVAPNDARIIVEFKMLHGVEAPDERSRKIAEMEAMLHRFEELPENWNSYGAPAPYPEAIREARWILTTVINRGLPEPWTVPGGDAGVGLQWETTQANLYIDIVPGEETTYALTPKTGAPEEDGVLTEKSLSEVLRRFAELTT